MKFLIVLIVLFFTLISCTKKTTENLIQNMDNCEVEEDSCVLTTTNMNGVSFVNVSYNLDISHIQPIKNINATWVTTMPFGFIDHGDDSVRYNQSFQWNGETKNGVIDVINLCHNNNLKVMLKPHIWVMGSWVGELEFTTESEWQTLENSYKSYILDFAFVADSMEAEAFCIGVELKKFAVQRPQFWNNLIDSVRSVYSGPITYAANWDNYENISFWNKLDFIGIDAYFPVSSNKTPSVNDLYNGWENDFNLIKSLSNNTGKKVIFTEFGYRNIDYTGLAPWDADNNPTYNFVAQENAYKAIFCRFWGESWFEGGFLWKWHPNHSSAGGNSNNRFTPQNKPVEELISNVFEKTN